MRDWEEDDEGKELIYECDCCGWQGHEAAQGREGRGEFWGAPAYESVTCCPRCGSAGLMEFYC